MQSKNNPQQKSILRQFWLSRLAIDNGTTVLIGVLLITLMGISAYLSMPRENFPEIKMPTIFVGVVYPGNSPVDMENLVARPIEKQLKSIAGVKDIKSTSVQDFANIVIEYNLNVPVAKALQDTKDAVDRAKSDLPNNLPSDPNVFELNFSEIPIMNINLSGLSDIDELNKYAEQLQEEIEMLPEITRVDIRGVPKKEVSINVDIQALQARGLSFMDIESAVQYENMTISGGDLLSDNVRRNIRIIGEFKTLEELKNIVIKSEDGAMVYLKDVAEVKFDYEERKSFARVEGKEALTCDVIKRSGQNLINAADKIKKIIETNKEKGKFSANLRVDVLNDQSIATKRMVDELQNSIVLGIILVVIVLQFFLRFRNAMFVGIAIPISMFIGFIILGFSGVTLNVMVLFSLILALGMLVDDGIVVVENIYRYMEEGYPPIEAAKLGSAEVAVPVLSATLTTICAFLPLLFWQDIMGEFMRFLPLTVIITLSASLFVAFVINPVLNARFTGNVEHEKINYKRLFIWVGIFTALAVFFYVSHNNVIGNLCAIVAGFMLLNNFVMEPFSIFFQNKILVALENAYKKFVAFALKGIMPYILISAMLVLLIASVVLVANAGLKVELFPSNEPNLIFVNITQPIGTDIEKTNAFTKTIEEKVAQTIEPYRFMVESVLAQVGEGTGNQNDFGGSSTSPNKSKITIAFVESMYRKGTSTNTIMEKVRQGIGNYPGVDIEVAKEENGPPVEPPINIEIKGEDFAKLVELANDMKKQIETANVPGIEELKLNVETNKPELIVDIDREKARSFGLSTALIAMTIRTAIFGKEISKFKVGEDDYPIQLRFSSNNRYDLNAVLNQKITFRNNRGMLMQVPISAIATLKYSSSYGSVKRRDLDRTITLYSNTLPFYNGNDVVSMCQNVLSNYKMPQGYELKFTGEQQDQQESMQFLMWAMMVAVFLIFIIIVAQFNSIIMPLVIMTQVLFSTIGVFLGYVFFKMDFIIIMTGIGIISLAGIVVKNGIVMIDYTNLLTERWKKNNNADKDIYLPANELRKVIIDAGATRLRPVLLTAITAILGLIPLAIGFNFNFFTLLTHFDPEIFIGGDNSIFWGPLAWTIVFGLTFSTFLTLVIVPVMYFLVDRMLFRTAKWRGKNVVYEPQIHA